MLNSECNVWFNTNEGTLNIENEMHFKLKLTQNNLVANILKEFTRRQEPR